MNKLHISQNQFSDLINLLNNVFFPLKNFVTKEEFLKIIYKKRFKKNFFLCQYTLVLPERHILNIKKYCFKFIL